jgi:hypothetical protein
MGGQHSRSVDAVLLRGIQTIELIVGFHHREALEALPVRRTLCRQDGDKSTGQPIWTP